MRVDCPHPEYDDSYIVIPDKWLGEHAARFAEADEKAEKLQGTVLKNFAIALALLDDWRLPGLEGNPDAWDFMKIDLEIIAWVGTTTLASYWQCFTVPKGS